MVSSAYTEHDTVGTRGRRPVPVCDAQLLLFERGRSMLHCDADDLEDGLLEKNFVIAQNEYEWIPQYKEKSVTELEFLHGMLLDHAGSVARRK